MNKFKLLTLTALLSASGAYAAATDAAAGALPAMSEITTRLTEIREALDPSKAPVLKRTDSASRFAREGAEFSAFSAERTRRVDAVDSRISDLQALKFKKDEMKAEELAIASLTGEGGKFEGKSLELVYSEEDGERSLSGFKLDGVRVTKPLEVRKGLEDINAALESAGLLVKSMGQANTDIETALKDLVFEPTSGVDSEESYSALRFDGSKVSERIKALIGDDVVADPSNVNHARILTLTTDQFSAIESIVTPVLAQLKKDLEEANEIATELVLIESRYKELKKRLAAATAAASGSGEGRPAVDSAAAPAPAPVAAARADSAADAGGVSFLAGGVEATNDVVTPQSPRGVAEPAAAAAAAPKKKPGKL